MRWTLWFDAIAYVKGRGLGKGRHSGPPLSEAGGLLQNAIYIYTQNQDFGRSENGRFLDRFWIGFWIDFGDVFGLSLDRFLDRFWKGV